MTTHVYRAHAAEQAKANGHVGFRTRVTKEGMWKMHYEPGDSPAAEYAAGHPEWCAWAEVTWRGGSTAVPRDDEDPRRVAVLVVKCTYDELQGHCYVMPDYTLAALWVRPNDLPPGVGMWLCEPLDSERWPIFGVQVGQGQVAQGQAAPGGTKAPGAATGGTRAAPPPENRSTAGSPTKLVWEIADGMAGATRAEIVAACVAAGVNKSTAGTQYYHWKTAGGADRPR